MGASSTELVTADPSPPSLQRQGSLASFISARCCRGLAPCRNCLPSYYFDDLLLQFPFHKSAGGFLQRRSQKRASSWEESSSWLLGSRRLLESRKGLAYRNGGVVCAESCEVDDDVYYKPSPWKLFLRKMRAETKKMNCVRPEPAGFHYDAFSYAMNFDDGGWHPPQQYFLSSSSESSSSKIGARQT